MIQSVVIFVVQIRIYEYTPLSLYWWAPFNSLRTICYLFLIILPLIPCNHRFPLPSTLSTAPTYTTHLFLFENDVLMLVLRLVRCVQQRKRHFTGMSSCWRSFISLNWLE